jgi:hypothetical protein
MSRIPHCLDNRRTDGGGQPHTSAALYSLETFLFLALVLITVRAKKNPTAILRLEGLGKFIQFSYFIGSRTRNLTAGSIVLQSVRYR